MTEAEAYPCGRGYRSRAVARYSAGETVYVGPAYRAGDTYISDGFEGLYVVLASTGGEHTLERLRGSDEVTIYASRLSGASATRKNK